MQKVTWEKVIEGKIHFSAPKATVVSRELPVFYNPVMGLNRSLAVTLLKALGRKNLQIADPLAGTGIRAARFLKELPRGTMKHLFANDANPLFKKKWNKMCTQNKLSRKNTTLGATDASLFLLQQSGFDYVDIDPFGSPNPFLDASCKRLSRDGILAITATDTAALAGTSPGACKRKYDSLPHKTEHMHELGMRILVRKAQLVAAQYEKALLPVFCHATEHYYRAYLVCKKSNSAVDDILRKHGFLDGAGPLWTGALWDLELVKRMRKLAVYEDEKELISRIAEEAVIPAVLFVDIHATCSRLGIPAPKTENLMKLIRDKKYLVGRTHFSKNGLRTTMPAAEVERLLRSLNNH